jgi:hypothetical protein
MFKVTVKLVEEGMIRCNGLSLELYQRFHTPAPAAVKFPYLAAAGFSSRRVVIRLHIPSHSKVSDQLAALLFA